MTDTEKDIAALDIGIQAIEWNKAAIEECKEQMSRLEGKSENATSYQEHARYIGKISAYESILKILEGEE